MPPRQETWQQSPAFHKTNQNKVPIDILILIPFQNKYFPILYINKRKVNHFFCPAPDSLPASLVCLATNYVKYLQFCSDQESSALYLTISWFRTANHSTAFQSISGSRDQSHLFLTLKNILQKRPTKIWLIKSNLFHKIFLVLVLSNDWFT